MKTIDNQTTKNETKTRIHLSDANSSAVRVYSLCSFGLYHIATQVYVAQGRTQNFISLPSPSFPSFLLSSLSFHSLRCRTPPFLIAAIGGVGERSSSPSGPGRSAAAKRILSQFGLSKTRPVTTSLVILYDHVTCTPRVIKTCHIYFGCNSVK